MEKKDRLQDWTKGRKATRGEQVIWNHILTGDSVFDTVIVHHITDRHDFVQLEVERVALRGGHWVRTFERIVR